MDGSPIPPEQALLSLGSGPGLDTVDERSGGAGTLYLQYAPILRRIAARKYDVPLSDVDALVHDVFATYLTNPSGVRDLRAYLIGGICNASRQYWRERRREVPLCAGEQELVADGTFDGLAERLTVAATVARLRSRCREVLRRYYFEGDRTDSIAAAIDTSARNVIYLLHICRNRARQIYEQLTRVR
ncbi:MAG: RNA polymerase sigma factor [Thermoanaerobaculia bacterium]